jgi:hypothetical protein
MAEEFLKGTGKRLKQLGINAAETGGRIIAGAASGIERAVTSQETNDAVEKGKASISTGRQALGNVVQTGKDIAHRVAGAITDVYGAAQEGVDKLYTEFEGQFYTDGKLDNAKVDAVLANKAQAAKIYGTKIIDFLRTEAKAGSVAVVAKYRELAPTREELETYRTDGIATDYHGILFKPDLQQCQDYRNEARGLLHSRLKQRNQILADIGANVIGSKRELLAYYKANNNTQLAGVVKERL